MLSVREHVRLARQIGSATVHEINTGKPAVGSNLLQSKVLLQASTVAAAAAATAAAAAAAAAAAEATAAAATNS
eukprot:357066-Chlamydomonas_euryale.AAC.8